MTDHDEWSSRQGGWARRLRRRIQNRLWTRDEEWAVSRGYRSRRSRLGWSIEVRDPRWDLRSECACCAGSGRGTDGGGCTTCAGTGVVSLPERDGNGGGA